MKECRICLQEIINKELIQAIFSNTKDSTVASKVKVRPIEIKGELLFQETLYRGTQVFHENLTAEAMVDKLEGYLENLFRQAAISCEKEEVNILISKKGTCTIKRKKKTVDAGKQAPRDLSHNRTKQYILQEGKPVDFLVGLGVQTPEGKVAKVYYDKFRQINRYLEFIEDILEKLPKDRTIRIIDFGCGKSYLTFAMYYYLKELQGRDIRVTGLDLKADVIRHCNELAQKLHYDHLDFQVGDIKDYNEENSVDMVVSLHACDKATDYALEKAVKWGASVILAVPCCQHELNGQIHCDMLRPALKYGLIKERMAALFTDALRANLLEQQGYETQILEFIDMEHTPKNLLIRAVKSNSMRPKTESASLAQLTDFLQVDPTLQHLLQN
ncbi:MAG: SAM-dependent methyltransferase [Acetatifactor sp.]|nr:SAM-dependent methyltransferase [Acetatifactor sp.]